MLLFSNRVIIVLIKICFCAWTLSYQAKIFYSHIILVHMSQILPIYYILKTNNPEKDHHICPLQWSAFTNARKLAVIVTSSICVFAAQELCTKCVLLHFHCHYVQSQRQDFPAPSRKYRFQMFMNIFNWCFASYLWVNTFALIIFVHWNTFCLEHVSSLNSTEFENPGSIIWWIYLHFYEFIYPWKGISGINYPQLKRYCQLFS